MDEKTDQLKSKIEQLKRLISSSGGDQMTADRLTVLLREIEQQLAREQ